MIACDRCDEVRERDGGPKAGITPDEASKMKSKLHDIAYWTLRGGNDPSDKGDVTRAVDELIDVVELIIDRVTIKEN